MVTDTLTSDEGSFQFNTLQQGAYILSASSIGFEKYYSNIFTIDLQRSSLSFDEIVMAAETVNLDAVEVSANRIQLEQIAEGTIINVQSSIVSKGGRALQILEW
jgi:iron complex outermembrane recepter protein